MPPQGQVLGQPGRFARGTLHSEIKQKTKQNKNLMTWSSTSLSAWQAHLSHHQHCELMAQLSFKCCSSVDRLWVNCCSCVGHVICILFNFISYFSKRYVNSFRIIIECGSTMGQLWVNCRSMMGQFLVITIPKLCEIPIKCPQFDLNQLSSVI